MIPLLRALLQPSATLLALVPLVAGAEPVFTPLGDLPGGSFNSSATAVSADGTTVVGTGNSGSSEAFRWTSSGGMVGLGELPGGVTASDGRAVSGDGTRIGGRSESANGGEAYTWTAGTGMVGMGDLPGSGFFSSTHGISADGVTLVGFGHSALTNPRSEAFRFTDALQMVAMGELAGGLVQSRADAVSDDGSVIVGRSESANGAEAYRWTDAGGMVGLGDLAGGGFASRALAVSSDGSVVAGRGESAAGPEAFRWTSAGMVGLGDLPGGDHDSEALGISGDGSRIVGRAADADGDEAFLWDAANGMRPLADVLFDLGIDLTGWELRQANGISADGRIVVGTARNPDGFTEAWVADLSPDCDDGIDNDVDLLVDHVEDPDCADADCDRFDERLRSKTAPTTATTTATAWSTARSTPQCVDASDPSRVPRGLRRRPGQQRRPATSTARPIRSASATWPDTTEVCNDFVDNDGDGDIDCSDSDLVDWRHELTPRSATDGGRQQLETEPGQDCNDGHGLRRVSPVCSEQCTDDLRQRRRRPHRLRRSRLLRRPVCPEICNDGQDNDGDGGIDLASDIGCKTATSAREDPACQDGVNNDGDGLIDFDGGLSVLGAGHPDLTDPDPHCVQPWRAQEHPQKEGCGLGSAGVGLVLLAFLWGRRRDAILRHRPPAVSTS